MKLLISMEVESTNPYEKLVYDLIQAQPPKLQREFILSAILYYAKSPSFLTETKMSGYLERLTELNSIFTDDRFQSLVAKIEGVVDLQDNLIQHVSKAIVSRVEAALDGIDFSKSSTKIKAKVDHVATPEDVLSKMMEDFSTNG